MNLYGISNSIKGNNANAVSELSDVFRNTKELEKEIEECKYLEKCCYNIINDFNINQIEKLLDYYFLLSENSEKLNNYVYIATVLEKNIDDETTENVNAIYSKTMDIFDNITRIINNIQEDDLLLSNFKYKKYIDYIKKEQSFKLNKEDLLELSNINNQYYQLTNSINKPYVYNNLNFEELNFSKYHTCMKNDNRDYRKKVFKRYYASFEKHEKDFAHNLDTFVVESNKITTGCGYKSTRDYCLSKTGVSEEVYNTALKVVNNNINKLHDYYKVKMNMLEIPSLEAYDMYFYSYNDDTYIAFDDAKAMIINALQPLGEEYTMLVKKMFQEGWIIKSQYGDFKNSEEVDFYNVHPYIIVNYTGNIEDVYTLIHEIGHAIHSYIYSYKYDYWECLIPEFLSEFYSSLCEILLANYLIENSKNMEEKKINIIYYLDMIRGSVYKQAQITEFEDLLYQNKIDTDLFSKSYLLLLKKYNPYMTDLSEVEALEWCRLTSLYMSYYSYQYITSFCAAVWIINTDINKCFQLTDINSFSDIQNEMKKIGIDFEKENLYDCLFKTFSGYTLFLERNI